MAYAPRDLRDDARVQRTRAALAAKSATFVAPQPESRFKRRTPRPVAQPDFGAQIGALTSQVEQLGRGQALLFLAVFGVGGLQIGATFVAAWVFR